MDVLIKKDVGIGTTTTTPAKGFGVDIEDATLRNERYRRVLKTYEGAMQLVVMSVPVGGEIPWERHPTSAQFIRVEAGRGMVLMGGAKGRIEEWHKLKDGVAVMVPPGRWHHVRNTCDTKPLKLYTVYCPPVHHDDDT